MKAAPSARQLDGQGLGKQGHESRGNHVCLVPEAQESEYVQEAAAASCVRAEAMAGG